MEVLAHYLRLGFIAAIVMLLIAGIMFLAIRHKNRNKNNEAEISGRLRFYKMIVIAAAVYIPLYLLAYAVYFKNVPVLKYTTDAQFESAYLKNFRNHNLKDSTRNLFYDQSMIYLKNRHHDKIFFDDFAFDKADSIELSFIIYYIKHPDVNDSVKLELRNNIKTTSDIEKYMN
ncbi:MAG TPA: hypothetical protein DHV29_09425 [Bacteroidales bacterium]|nr:MAG: hypothetical protein A2W94_07310 [Bacteroidetes bacterium GWE2_42_42]HCB62576.1 hypothetical protein [Bacteroidales bacterium]HCY23696.1 hypothetical protein [Bacteroidales bacterium]